MVLPSKDLEIDEEYWLIDDDLVDIIKRSFNTECRILLLFDCCHSGTMADIDCHRWDHKICSISACCDDEEDADPGKGGLLTISLANAIFHLGKQRGTQSYSIQ